MNALLDSSFLIDLLKMRGRLVGHDPKAFARLGPIYCDHRSPSA